jgi:hypothetical protein
MLIPKDFKSAILFTNASGYKILAGSLIKFLANKIPSYSASIIVVSNFCTSIKFKFSSLFVSWFFLSDKYLIV